MKRILIVLFLLIFFLLNINAQKKNFSFDLGSSVGYLTSGHVPFWLRSNQFGSIPLDNASLSLNGTIRKDYDNSKSRILDWGASFEGRANIGYKSNLTIIEGYCKLRISVFEIRAGRSKEIIGLCDTIITSGSFSISGNALGIPKVQVSIPEFYSLPLFGRLFAFKSNFAHGWIGEIPTRLNGNTHKEKTYFHQKSLYGRFGKTDWKWKLYGGVNHQVFWGNEKNIFGNDYTLSGYQTYLYVITGKEYSTSTIEPSRIGNHLGSVDLGFEYEFKYVRLFIYRQNFYDFTAFMHLENLRDGLNGLCLTNKHNTGNVFQFKKVLVEFFYSKDQGVGLASHDPTYSNENYYNHYIYTNGWSYNGIGLGTPFIIPKTFIRKGLSPDNYDYFISNRVAVFHIGYEGSIQEWDFILKTSYSLNYGTYGTSLIGNINQLSAYLEANRELKNGLRIGFTGAFDVGELYYNSVGALFNISKSF